MYTLIILSAVLAVASAGILGAAPLVSAPLLPRVQVAPAQVNVVKQPITLQQPEYRIRQVPVPVTALSYSAAPVVSYAAGPAISYAAAPVVSYAAGPAISYAAAPALAYSAGLASPLAYSTTIAGHGIVKVH